MYTTFNSRFRIFVRKFSKEANSKIFLVREENERFFFNVYRFCMICVREKSETINNKKSLCHKRIFVRIFYTNFLSSILICCETSRKIGRTFARFSYRLCPALEANNCQKKEWGAAHCCRGKDQSHFLKCHLSGKGSSLTT